MRKTILTTLAVLAIGGAATGTMIAYAQPGPPPAPPGTDGPGGPPGGPPGMMGMMGAWMRHGPPGGPGGPRGGPIEGGPRAFALIYPQKDRKLTPPDVQKIAEAFLLWHGNHTWKVVEVAPAADDDIKFGIATPEGSVIAHFTMDAHTGRVARVD